MKFIYLGGPYFSRRLGVSLGVNILKDFKICTFNCKYCEIGKTAKENFVSVSTTLSFERDCDEYSREIERMLIEYPEIDSITFGYYGEPTLAGDLKYLAMLTRDIKKKSLGEKEKPLLSIFTNSSAIFIEDVRDALHQFDQIIFKLDCITEEDFQYFNQPHPTTPNIIEIIKGIRDFIVILRNNKSKSKVIIQSLFMKESNSERSNYSKEKFKDYIKIINEIKPDVVHIYSVSRSPAFKEIKPITLEEKMEIKDLAQKLIDKDIKYKIL